MKKFLSLVLALVMTMSLVTISAGAADFTDDEAITYKEAVEVMTAAGVVSGYADGSFKPGTALNRGQAAKIICNMILGPTTAAALATTDAPFKDVPADHVFAGYIAYCVTEGIISGYADGTFKPAAPLTGYAFMKMLLGALGYDADIEGYNQPSWSVQVAKRALNIELDDGLKGDFNGTKALTREEACLYAFNTMKSTMVDYGNKTAITIGDINITTSAEVKEVYGKNDTGLEIGDEYLQFCEKYFEDLEGYKDTDVWGRPATTWKWDGDKVGTYTKEAKYVITFDKWYDADAFADEAEFIDELIDITGNKKLENKKGTGVNTYVNGLDIAYSDIWNGYDTGDVDDNGDPIIANILNAGITFEIFVKKNDITDIVIKIADVVEVTDVEDELSAALNKKGATYEIELTYLNDADEYAETFYDAHDKKSENVLPGFDAETYVEDAIVVVYPNWGYGETGAPAEDQDTVLASYIPEAVEGVLNSFGVTDKYDRSYSKVDGTKYPEGVNMYSDDPELGKEQSVYLTEEGFIIAIVGPSAQNIEDVYYITGVYESTSTKGKVSYFAEAVALNGEAVDLKLESGDDLIDFIPADEVWGKVDGLYIMTDEKVGTHKANDKKYDSDEFDYFFENYDEEDETTAFNGYVLKAVADTLEEDVKSSDTKMDTSAAGKIYFDEDTTLIAVEKAQEDLKVTTANGGMKMAAQYKDKNVMKDAYVWALIDVEELKVASHVIYVTGDADAAVEADEVVYVTSWTDFAVNEGDTYIFNAWFMGEIDEVEITADEDYTGGYFYHFSTDEDGVYTMTELDLDDMLDEVDDGDDGFYYGASFTKASTYKSALTIADASDIEDVDYSNAVVNDDRESISGSAVYDSEIDSVSRLNKAIKAGEVIADIYVNDGEIVFINVLDVVAY